MTHGQDKVKSNIYKIILALKISWSVKYRMDGMAVLYSYDNSPNDNNYIGMGRYAMRYGRLGMTSVYFV